jgi:hypothetical protein
MLDLGLTWDLAKEQCGGDGKEKTVTIQSDDPALPWAGLHDISKQLRHSLAERGYSQSTNRFTESWENLFLAAIEEGLRFGDSGEFSGPDNFCYNGIPSEEEVREKVGLSRKLYAKLLGGVTRLSLEINNQSGIGSTEDEIILNALQVGLRQDVFPRLRAYIGSTGAALATETPIDSDFGELTMNKIATALPKGELTSGVYISGNGLRRMSSDLGERVGLENISGATGLTQRVILVQTGLDEKKAYHEYAEQTPNLGWQVDSSRLSLSKTIDSEGDWRERRRYFGFCNYSFTEYLECWPDNLTFDPSGSTKGTSNWTPEQIKFCLKRQQEVDRALAPHLPRAWEAIGAYYKKLRELRVAKSSRPAET